MGKALITGGSSGIGRDIARYLYSLGWDLVLVARNVDKMQSLKKSLLKKRRGNIKIIPLDLSERNSPFELFKMSPDVNMLVNNAGFGVFGEFSNTSLETELNMIDVNIRCVHVLTKLYCERFSARNSGIILNVASVAGFMPGPLMSAYYATKSYVLNLSVALAEELRRKSKKSGVQNKVRICTLCPGPVNTDFDSRAGVAFSLPSMSSEKVAKYAVDNALKGKTVIIPGALIKLVSVLSSCFPKTVSAKIAYKQQERKMYNV